MAFELPPLPYAKDALEPHMSAKTLDFHHGKHHQAYVTNLNNLLKDSPLANESLEGVIKASANREVASQQLQTLYALSEIQAKAILEMQLQRLTGLEKEKILSELKARPVYFVAEHNLKSAETSHRADDPPTRSAAE